MNIAICDDEQEYIEEIRTHVVQYFTEYGLPYEMFVFNTSRELIGCDKEFDIVFLDVEIDELNGIEIGKIIHEKNPDTVLILITAHNHYLDSALDIGITRFFEKPIDRERFRKGLEKAISKIDSARVNVFLTEYDKRFIEININDIIYVEIQNRKTKVVTKQKTYLCKENIKYWKEKLNKSFFETPHNSFIVNTNFITYYCKEYVILDDKYNVPIAFSRRAEFKKRFMMSLED